MAESGSFYANHRLKEIIDYVGSSVLHRHGWKKELADALGIHPSIMSKIAHTRSLQLGTVLEIASRAKIPAEFFIEDATVAPMDVGDAYERSRLLELFPPANDTRPTYERTLASLDDQVHTVQVKRPDRAPFYIKSTHGAHIPRMRLEWSGSFADHDGVTVLDLESVLHACRNFQEWEIIGAVRAVQSRLEGMTKEQRAELGKDPPLELMDQVARIMGEIEFLFELAKNRQPRT